jgi:hypothetical protein
VGSIPALSTRYRMGSGSQPESVRVGAWCNRQHVGLQNQRWGFNSSCSRFEEIAEGSPNGMAPVPKTGGLVL